ncbi:hypothetical protein [Natronorubrum sp. FCH18a]|uniref:hypothetical protein n=1 Tax=Natronorubrum sp. FCH18a TaxID=3447018 RepID=UPI003F515934
MVLETDIEDVAAQRDDLPTAGDAYDTDEEIPVTDLFAESFIQERTEFDSFDEMVAASPSDADTTDELETVPHGVWDEFVAETTAFEDEQSFVMAARDHWVATKLDLN